MSEFRDLLLRELDETGFSESLSEGQIAALEEHYQLLSAWNRKINLTSIRTIEDSVRRHYCECLHFASLLRERSEGVASSLLDAGSGPGFPGIPIALLLPEWRVALVESDRRKAVFLREACRKLANTSVVCERLQQVQTAAAWIVSRAVRPADVVGELPRLGRSVGLLLGPAGASEARSESRITWLPDIPLPYGERTVALFGTYSQ